MNITCNWLDKYTARYTVRTDGNIVVNVTGDPLGAQSETRRVAGIAPDAPLPDPVPYSPPIKARPFARETMPRTAHDTMPGDFIMGPNVVLTLGRKVLP